MLARANFTTGTPPTSTSWGSADRVRIEAELQGLVDPPGLPSTPFREAMKYAVLGAGQRLRPLLAMRIARLVGHDNELTLRAAAAVEILHCASLVVDDLPCMDDEAERRGRPTTHKVYGDATALLASFGMVALAGRCVVDIRCTPTELSSLIRFQIELLKMLDASGLCEGQDLDLKLTGDSRESQRARVNEMKTVPLFDLAAQAGLLFCDPNTLATRQLRRFAQEFGRAYQIADDYLDGEIEDFETVMAQLKRAGDCLEAYRPAAGELQGMLDYLHERCIQHPRP
jgi:farnesyl diphosphate synthase